MQLPINWTDDRSVRAAFTYVTKARMAPKFGTIPIAYYQQDCCKAIDALYQAACRALGVAENGTLTIRIRQHHGQWETRIVGTRGWVRFNVVR